MGKCPERDSITDGNLFYDKVGNSDCCGKDGPVNVLATEIAGVRLSVWAPLGECANGGMAGRKSSHCISLCSVLISENYMWLLPIQIK